METPKSSDILALCKQYFPGLDWICVQDSADLNTCYQAYVAEVRPYFVRFELTIQYNGALLEISTSREILMRSLNEQGQTPEQALARVKELWMEYCHAVTGALCAKPEEEADEA